MTSKTYRVRRHQDDATYVYRKLRLDPYVKSIRKFSRPIKVDKPRCELMSAKEARDKKLPVADDVADDHQVAVKWIEQVPDLEFWTEVRLVPRNLPRKWKPQKVRFDLAEAIEKPLDWLYNQEDVDAVIEKLRFWEDHDMGNKPLEPIYLVFLGQEEEADSLTGYKVNVFTREICNILRYGKRKMVIQNFRGNVFQLEIDPAVWKETFVRQLVLFFPSNIHVHDSTSNKLIF